jgi:hypothetical protein
MCAFKIVEEQTSSRVKRLVTYVWLVPLFAKLLKQNP